jgi:hypothetical protein
VRCVGVFKSHGFQWLNEWRERSVAASEAFLNILNATESMHVVFHVGLVARRVHSKHMAIEYGYV